MKKIIFFLVLFIIGLCTDVEDKNKGLVLFYTEPIIEYETTTSTTDYEDPGELSITNMINIILIVVGVVLILLGIAIIIKLK